jgi:flavin reductase (DIM6/NTAB) family NADH-FMN oxidoreductase RutF
VSGDDRTSQDRTSQDRAFQDIVATIDYPMWIVTVAAGGERSGCLVGFTTQCSIDPPVFGVWLSKANHTFDVASGADVFVVHALRESDLALAQLFGSETGDELDKFTRCSWRPGPADTPVLDGCDWFAGRVLQRIDTGDHVAFVLEPLTGETRDGDAPRLGFQRARAIEPGHEAG